MMRLFSALAVVAAFSSPAIADDDQRLVDGAKCSFIPDSLARLVCFDKVFPANSGAEVATAPTEPAAEVQTDEDAPLATTTIPWSITSERSAIDDSPTVMAILIPVSSSGTGIGDPNVGLIIRCLENTTSVIISTSMFMTEDRVSVTTRIGSDPARTTRWDRSTNYKSVGLWTGGQSIPFLRSLRDNERLVVRVEERDRVDAEFNLASVSKARSEVAAACGWTP